MDGFRIIGADNPETLIKPAALVVSRESVHITFGSFLS